MNRTIEKKEYRFDEIGHKHEFLKDGEWKPLMGVTTVLSVISKPALIQWSANMAADYVDVEWLKIGVKPVAELKEDWERIIKESKSAHRKKKEKAGDWGTEVHAWIENYINGKNPTPLEGVEQRMGCEAFAKWATENKVKFLGSEKHVFSEKMWIGGILDMVIELDGQRLIADVKTSSGIYNEAFFQMAAYDLCMEEMGESVDGYLVINIKKTGEFDLKIAPNKEINRRAFLSALELYKIINSIQ